MLFIPLKNFWKAPEQVIKFYEKLVQNGAAMYVQCKKNDVGDDNDDDDHDAMKIIQYIIKQLLVLSSG